MRIPILYRDADIVVVDKPAGIPTHAVQPDDPYPGDALRMVQAQLGLPYLGMHQRLDAETSGVLLFAARPIANPALASAFSGREVHKVYLALVHGRPQRDAGVIDAPIAREHGERYQVTTPGDQRGQRAVTRYRLLATDPSGHYCLLEVRPETGRSHQIRVHLAHIGMPVVGDALYGPATRSRGGLHPAAAGRRLTDSGTPAAAQAAPHLCLHAYQLTLPHPATGQAVTFTAPPPAILDERRVAAGLPELEPAVSDWLGRALAGPAPNPDRRAREALQNLLAFSIARRAPLAADPATTIYRLVNGAADGLPGLTVDHYGDALVLSIYGEEEASEAPRPVPAPLLDAVARVVPGRPSIYVKYRPRQASRVSEDETGTLAPAEPVLGSALGEYPASEDGLIYWLRPGEGWSPGLFPDMREMRGRVRAWSAGRRVINCFAYTCGFGVAAVAGGATRVLNLDLSKAVLARGQANYQANGFTPDPHDFVYGDVFDWLNRLARRQDRFDLVILDPPGFSKTKTRHFNAERDYAELAAMAARVTAPDGLIVACCNVAELPWRSFRDRVLAGFTDAGRAALVSGVYHAPAIDFPTPTGHESYLKILVARLA